MQLKPSAAYHLKLSAPLDLMKWAARRALGHLEPLAPVVAEITDWNAVMECATVNHLIPLLARTLGDQPLVPLSVRRDIDRRYVIRAAHNEFLWHEQEAVMADFDQSGIPALAYKGCALAIMAYGGLALRHPASDIDLLVLRKDIPTARKLLEIRGYQVNLLADEENHVLRHRYHLHCERSNPEIHVELHWALTPAYWPFKLDVWTRTDSIAIEGSSVPTLSPECALLSLCAHGAKEGWPRLSQVLDVGSLIGACPNLDWEWVLAEARRLRRRRVVRLGLQLASIWTGAPLPAHVEQDLAEDPTLAALVKKVGENFEVGYFIGAFRPFGLRLWNNPEDRVRYFLYILRFVPERILILLKPNDGGPAPQASQVAGRAWSLVRQRGPRHVLQQAIKHIWWRPP